MNETTRKCTRRNRIILSAFVGISILFTIVNWRDINSFLAYQNLLWFKNVIDRKETVMFRSSWVDSLYVKKEYRYYLFMKEEMDSKAIQNLPYGSVLAIKPICSPSTFVKEDIDTISLPVSVLDIML